MSAVSRNQSCWPKIVIKRNFVRANQFWVSAGQLDQSLEDNFSHKYWDFLTGKNIWANIYSPRIFMRIFSNFGGDLSQKTGVAKILKPICVLFDAVLITQRMFYMVLFSPSDLFNNMAKWSSLHLPISCKSWDLHALMLELSQESNHKHNLT